VAHRRFSFSGAATPRVDDAVQFHQYHQEAEADAVKPQDPRTELVVEVEQPAFVGTARCTYYEEDSDDDLYSQGSHLHVSHHHHATAGSGGFPPRIDAGWRSHPSVFTHD